MLLVLAGSSGSGKSAIRRFLLEGGAPLVAGLPLRSHDFDENGVPIDANTEWRQRNGELWIERALEHAELGEHLLLSANWPLGEVLATPSAPLLDGIALCLIDCSDTERAKRLRARQHTSYTDRHIWDFVLFAAWQRLHHADPTWMPEVIVGHWPKMVWERWQAWAEGDPRWAVPTFDTSNEAIEESATRVATWIQTQVSALERGVLPLRQGAW